MNIKIGDFGTPVISSIVAIMISFGLVLIADSTLTHISARVSRVITVLALAAFTVVLVHPAILWALGPLDLPQWAIFTFALVVPWGIGLAALRTKYSVWLTGAERLHTALPAPR
jgi:hypothetical protein